MVSIALVIYAGTETEADRGRLFNGLEAASELSNRVNNEVKLIFDGAGTKWVPRLEDPSHEYHALYRDVEDIAVCEGCVREHGVIDSVEDANVTVIESKGSHTSVFSLVHGDYEVLTF